MSRFNTIRFVAALLAALLMSGPAGATTYRELSLPEMLDSAQIAFFGTVAAVRIEEREGEPWTVVEFEIERLLAGSADNSPALELSFLGGDLPGGAGYRINLMPGFEVGEQVLLLAYAENYISPIVGFNQGLWRQAGEALLDESGRRLSLDDEGRLVHGGLEGGFDLVLDAVDRELEARQ
ncbi:MAG: hypothetical protein WD273_11505 [Trueperaceae bacterium]